MGIYIEIALSLILIFLVLSLVVTAINELIAMQLRKRPKMLFRTIAALIDDEGLRAKFYGNGIVVSAKEASAGSTLPAGGNQIPAQGAVGTLMPVTDANHPSYINGQNFARALTMAVLKSSGNQGPLNAVFQLPEVEKAVLALPPTLKIRDVLIGALASTTGSVDDFEKKLATWFDTTQDRLTGEYARHQRWITLAVGGLLVTFLNADVIRLSRELQTNDSLRTNMVAEAQGLFKVGVDSACAGKTDDEREACIIDETRGLLVRLEPALIGWNGDPALTTAQGLLASAQGLFVSDATAAQAAEQAPVQEAAANPLGIILNKLLGLMITVMAVSLGAPFWFDMLNKVVNIRGAGIKPDKTAPQV